MKTTVDLHGIHHIDVRNIVIRKVEDCWNTNTDIIFITGISDKMKSIVISVLKEYKLSYRIGDGVNPGFIKTTLSSY